MKVLLFFTTPFGVVFLCEQRCAWLLQSSPLCAFVVHRQHGLEAGLSMLGHG